jgi:hypothetical protein
LVVFHDFEKLVSRISASSVNADSINQISKSDAIVILGSSFVGALAYTYSDSFGLMRWKQKCTLWLLYLYLYFWLGLRWEQEMDSPRGNRWLLVISYWIIVWVHFMALLTIPSIGLLTFF